MRATITALVLVIYLSASLPALSEEAVSLKFSRPQIEELWRSRIMSFLNKGMIPLIDLESSLDRTGGMRYLKKTLPVMDRLGVALIALDGYQAPKSSKARNKKGYRWGYYIHSVVNAHPERFILTTNGGTNSNWINVKGGKSRHYIDQIEQQVRTGKYPIMGEFEFRHYMSKSQCKNGLRERDVNVPIDSENAHRLFQLSAETGIPFVIHHEPEDKLVAVLEKMLSSYPKAIVIWAHFGQIRKPHLAKLFSASLVRHDPSGGHAMPLSSAVVLVKSRTLYRSEKDRRRSKTVPYQAIGRAT